MDYKKRYIWLFVCQFLILLHSCEASRIVFRAYPDQLKANLTTADSMRCDLIDTEVTRSVTNTTDDISHVISILVTRNDGQDVAQASPYEAPSALADLGNLQVKGDVSGSSSEGYIELTWRTPALVPTGQYSCEVMTIDGRHHHTLFRDTLRLTRAEPSVNDVVIMVQQQNQMIQDLQQTVSDQKTVMTSQTQEIGNLKQQVTLITDINNNQSREIVSLKQEATIKTQIINNHTLEIRGQKACIANHSAEINNLKSCTRNRVSFLASLSVGKTMSINTPVVYDQVIHNTNNVYDPKTGHFTAPTAGVYLVTVRSLSAGGDADLKLLVNTVKITSLVKYNDANAYNSQSASLVLFLKAGDTVSVATEGLTNSNDLYQNTAWAFQANMFSAVLLHGDNCLA